MTLFVSQDGKQLGPFTLEEARAALANGTLRPADLAWADGMPSWLPLSAVLSGVTAGTPPALYQAGAPGGPKVSGLAIASLILGILSCCCLSIFAGIPAVICGHIAWSRIHRRPAVFNGSGLALGGLITGYISFLLLPIMAGLAVPALVGARERALEVRSLNNAHLIAVACMTYAAAHGGKYPATIEELVPAYVPDARALADGQTGTPPPVGFDYFAANKVHPGPKETLLVSKWKGFRGRRVRVEVSGAASLLREDGSMDPLPGAATPRPF